MFGFNLSVVQTFLSVPDLLTTPNPNDLSVGHVHSAWDYMRQIFRVPADLDGRWCIVAKT